MTAPARPKRAPSAKYPTKAMINRVVAQLSDAAKAAGIKVGGVECTRDGTIRVLEASNKPAGSAYDEWKGAGD
jgi:hypothetical protein